MPIDLGKIADDLHVLYGLTQLSCKNLLTPTNDVIEAASEQGHFALKLYRATTIEEIRWEIDLILHLLEGNVPVVRPVPGKNGYLTTFTVGDDTRIGVLFEWVQGEKPKDGIDTYYLIGRAAAQIHQAADTFISRSPHTNYDANLLIDQQIARIRPLLVESGRMQKVVDLVERLRVVVSNPELDYGICHMDLKPDNIHLNAGKLTVFDFNSSGESWRAIEAYRVLRLSDVYFQSWLDGYRSIRPFSEADERAVAAFGIIGDIRSVVWDLGLASSSRGEPLLTVRDLPRIVEDWLVWERVKVTLG